MHMKNVAWHRSWPLLAVVPLAGLGAALLYGNLVERHHLRDRRVEIEVPGLPDAFDGYRIVQLSDFHMGGRAWSPSTIRRAVELALSKRGDLIVLTGDFVESTPAIAACAELLAPLRAPDGVLAVLGNHDYWNRAVRVHTIVQTLQDLGIRVLRNESYRLRRDRDDLWIVGLDDAYSGHDYIPNALAGVPQDAKPLVLSHYPDLAWRLGPDRWAAVLSGHAHGSQVRLPIVARYATQHVAKTRFSHGLYEINRIPVFVTTGIGTSGRPVRLFARPEVATIVLRAVPAGKRA
jgi:predicted MPP superfamily phosphohydrolase